MAAESIPWLPALLALGATARITRLIVRDTITEPLRVRLRYSRAQRREIRETQRPPESPTSTIRRWIIGVISCAWCASIWTAAVVGVCLLLWGNTLVYQTVTGVLTLAYAAGWLLSAEPR